MNHISSRQVDYYDDEDDDNYTYSEMEQDYEDSWNDE